MTLPIVHLDGPPHQQGRQHGEALREQVARNLTIYFDRFAREAKLTREEVLERARAYAAVLRRVSPDYFATMEGVAVGGGFTLDEIVALNVRYELLYYQFGKLAMSNPDGCTAFALLPDATAPGHLIIGQNWDWIPDVRGAVLHGREPDGLHHLSFTEAGIVGGKIGLNSEGLGLAINGMTSTADDWSRLNSPFHVRTYQILRERTLEGARRIISDEPRACSTNYLIAQPPAQVLDLEAAPDALHVTSCERGCLTHANHFVDPDGLGIEQPPNPKRYLSIYREKRLRTLLDRDTPLTIAQIQSALADHEEHPYELCRHPDPADPPEQWYTTVTSVVMDLDERRLLLTDGNPCESDYQEFRL